MNENIKDAIEYASTDNIADMQSAIVSALQSKIADALEAKRIEVAQSFMQKANESEEPFDDFEEDEEELNEYEIVKVYNPKTGRHEYVDDEGNVMHGSNGASWQKSWYNRKKPSSYTSSSTSEKIYHNVPFKQKDQAKAEGMRFDGGKKKWYHTSTENSKKSAFPKLQESYLEEKLSVSDGISAWIKDFVHSDNPRFEGKSKEERRQMAMAAFYDAKKQQNEEIENIQELDKDTLTRYINKAGISRNDNRDAAKSAEAAAFKMKDDRIGDWKSMKSQEDSHNRTVKNREKGIKRASEKLTKNEEVEQIDELSRSGIISRYLNKTKPEYSSPKEIEKRKEGRSLALKKKMGNKKFGFPEPKVKAKD